MDIFDAWKLIDKFPVHRGDAMITNRFHPHLLAARAGATGYFDSSGEYYRTKHDAVLALGSPFKPLSKLEGGGFFALSGALDFQEDQIRVKQKRVLVERIYGKPILES